MINYTRIDPDYVSETHNVGNTSAQSSVIITGSGLVRIATTTSTHVKFGTNPTATTEDVLVPANHVEVFVFKSGEKIAFIRHGGGSGSINISAVD
jgi:hypothetical protein